MARKKTRVADWIDRYITEEAPRSKSLIVSAFGDSIAPSSEGVWLGDLIQLMAPFGLSDRLVRTSVFRLVEEGWLVSRREGRRSFYALTQAGAKRFKRAYGRIYSVPDRNWDGLWTMILIPRNGEAVPERSELRRQLDWEGFASPLPGLFLHPQCAAPDISRILESVGLDERVIALRAQTIEGLPSAPLETLAAQCWDLAGIGQRYERFIDRFAPLKREIAGRAPTPEQAFVAQTLLIHSFRRVVLYDPHLPSSLLPPAWPGQRAYELCRQIYQVTVPLAQAHLHSVTDTTADFRSNPTIQTRFGGLDAVS